MTAIHRPARRAQTRPARPGQPPPERQKDAKDADERTLREERILDAAAALLVRWGYRKTTIDDVAREAGVGKGTIYLHWKDKSDLFRATIWRASRQASEETSQRMAADPEGGLFHRMWAHGMLAVLSNPLLAALMKGNSDIFQGLLSTMDQETLDLIRGDAEKHLAQLQHVGLIRADLSIPVMTLLMGALKIGLIYISDIPTQEQMPTKEQLTDALSDLIRRWLEPERLPRDSAEGKQIMGEWLESINDITEQLQQPQ